MKIPIIRKTMPLLMAHDLTSMQPMDSDIVPSLLRVEESEHKDEFGDVIHNFINGWCVYDGKDHIDFVSFIDKFGYDSIKDCPKKKTLYKWWLGVKRDQLNTRIKRKK